MTAALYYLICYVLFYVNAYLKQCKSLNIYHHHNINYSRDNDGSVIMIAFAYCELICCNLIPLINQNIIVIKITSSQTV